jgi:dUTP pyrophosphatase
MKKFEVVSAYAGQEINLPQRKTKLSAGYDIEAAEVVVLLPGKTTPVKTGIKACMEDDEYLQLSLRSGFAIKNSLFMPNTPGIIDADYYDNVDNEGHIMVAIYNPNTEPFRVNKWDRIAQGIFLKYGTVDGEKEVTTVREGGLGHSGK